VCGYEVPELFYCATYREPCDLIAVKTCLCIFQFTIPMHYRQVCGNFGTDKTCVFLGLAANK
jgi:hypothetical protein